MKQYRCGHCEDNAYKSLFPKYKNYSTKLGLMFHLFWKHGRTSMIKENNLRRKMRNYKNGLL